MHRHAAVHVGGVQGQVVHLQHQLGQKEDFDLLGGSALGQEEVKDARGSNLMMWRHIERWQRSFLFRAHELEEAGHNLTVVGLEVLKLRQEVVGHPCMLLALVVVAKWDRVSRRDKLLTGKDRCRQTTL